MGNAAGIVVDSGLIEFSVGLADENKSCLHVNVIMLPLSLLAINRAIPQFVASPCRWPQLFGNR
mgnify:CR=1 FL=1